MPFIARRFLGIICLLSLVSPGLFAEDPPSPPLPDLDTILKNWHESASQHQSVSADFMITIYDNVFEVQSLGKGRVTVNRFGEAKYSVEGISPKAEIQPKRTSNGEKYLLDQIKSESWYWTKDNITQINERNRTYDQVNIPKDASHDSPWMVFISSGFWLSHPFLLGMPPEEIKQRYQLTITKQNAEQVWIKFKPNSKSDMNMWSEVHLILDLKTYLPYALKLVDPPGTKETVYLFNSANGTNEPERISEPDLMNYSPSVRENITEP